MRTFIIMIISSSFAVSCKTVDPELWTMNENVPVEKMKAKIIPRLNGQYISIEDGKNRRIYEEFDTLMAGREIVKTFILFEDGYAFTEDVKLLNKFQESKELQDDFGRFLIEGDSIKIQFFRTTLFGQISILWRPPMTVHELSGKILNDSTIAVTKLTAKKASEWYYAEQSKDYRIGIISFNFYPPVIFRFQTLNKIPKPVKNWLKDENFLDK